MIRKMRILITEDEYIIALDMKMLLEEHGYSVIGICASGEDAVKTAAENDLDLILMDIILQGEMDGIEAAQAIFKRTKVPILFCTANCDRETMNRLNYIHHAGVMHKPLEEKLLLDSVMNIHKGVH